MPLTRARERPDPPDDERDRSTEAHEAIVAESAQRLVALLEASTDPFAREAALTALARREQSFAAEALVQLIRGEDVALRNDAIEILGQIGERAIPWIESLLDDADPNLRIYALTALEGAESRRAAAIALRVALRDEHVNVVASAVDVVARCGAPDMAPALKAVPLRFPQSPFLAFAVRAALNKIG
jgi:HEAT repeat protein